MDRYEVRPVPEAEGAYAIWDTQENQAVPTSRLLLLTEAKRLANQLNKPFVDPMESKDAR